MIARIAFLKGLPEESSGAEAATRRRPFFAEFADLHRNSLFYCENLTDRPSSAGIVLRMDLSNIFGVVVMLVNMCGMSPSSTFLHESQSPANISLLSRRAEADALASSRGLAFRTAWSSENENEAPRVLRLVLRLSVCQTC
jgi:hypothetical protein